MRVAKTRVLVVKRREWPRQGVAYARIRSRRQQPQMNRRSDHDQQMDRLTLGVTNTSGLRTVGSIGEGICVICNAQS